jgi:hypothetical protein
MKAALTDIKLKKKKEGVVGDDEIFRRILVITL